MSYFDTKQPRNIIDPLTGKMVSRRKFEPGDTIYLGGKSCEVLKVDPDLFGVRTDWRGWKDFGECRIIIGNHNKSRRKYI